MILAVWSWGHQHACMHNPIIQCNDHWPIPKGESLARAKQGRRYSDWVVAFHCSYTCGLGGLCELLQHQQGRWTDGLPCSCWLIDVMGKLKDSPSPCPAVQVANAFWCGVCAGAEGEAGGPAGSWTWASAWPRGRMVHIHGVEGIHLFGCFYITAAHMPWYTPDISSESCWSIGRSSVSGMLLLLGWNRTAEKNRIATTVSGSRQKKFWIISSCSDK
jgi:hypothetical protein